MGLGRVEFAFWVYLNEIVSAGLQHNFFSYAIELTGGAGLLGGIGIEVSRFNYDNPSVGEGISAKYYLKIGLGLITEI